MDNTITLKDAMLKLRSGEHVCLAYVTADVVKKRGGKWIEIAECWGRKPEEKHTTTESFAPASRSKKNPNHDDNSTILLFLPNGEIRKAHIRLIRRINGKTII